MTPDPHRDTAREGGGGDGRDVEGWASPAERQAAARDAYLRSLDTAAPLTAGALGAMFDRSARWATDRMAEVRRAGNGIGTAAHRASDASGKSAQRPGSAADRQPSSTERARTAAATGSPQRRGGTPAGTADATGGASGEDGPVAGPPGGVQRLVRAIAWVAVAPVAAGAGIVSYEHLRTVAVMAGEEWVAWVLPLTVDGLIVASAATILVRHWAGLPAGAVPKLSLLVGITAYIAASEPQLAGQAWLRWLVAAWTPLAFWLSHHVVLALIRTPRPARQQQPSIRGGARS